METKKIKFSDCRSEFIEDTFQIVQVRNHEILDNWLQQKNNIKIDNIETTLLDRYKEILIDNVRTWIERELTEYFIAPLFALVNFNTDKFKLFCRRISATIDEIELYGEPDAIIATGRYSPKLPFFCLNEYKRQEENRGDAAGQALAAMLATQEQNKNDKPVYGIYVVGKYWHFMILKDKQYAISKAYVADDKEIFDIYKILKALKNIIMEMTNYKL